MVLWYFPSFKNIFHIFFYEVNEDYCDKQEHFSGIQQKEKKLKHQNEFFK